MRDGARHTGQSLTRSYSLSSPTTLSNSLTSLTITHSHHLSLHRHQYLLVCESPPPPSSLNSLYAPLAPSEFILIWSALGAACEHSKHHARRLLVPLGDAPE